MAGRTWPRASRDEHGPRIKAVLLLMSNSNTVTSTTAKSHGVRCLRRGIDTHTGDLLYTANLGHLLTCHLVAPANLDLALAGRPQTCCLLEKNRKAYTTSICLKATILAQGREMAMAMVMAMATVMAMAMVMTPKRPVRESRPKHCIKTAKESDG